MRTALAKYLNGTRTPAQIHKAVTGDVGRAARLVSAALASFMPSGPEPDG